MRRSARSPICIALALLLLTGPIQGCYAWRPVTPAVNPMTGQGDVRVTLASGKKLFLQAPYLSRDTLNGVVAKSGEHAAIPIDQVVEVAVRQVSAGRTAMLLVGVTTVILAIVLSSNDSPPPPPEPISCPFLYSWDGSGWRLDSGTFGGAIMKPLARADVDNLDYASAERDTVRLKLANELEETDHVDQVELLAADHEPGVTVAPDGNGQLHALVAPQAPVSAQDFRGREALPRIRSMDGWRWESVVTGRDPEVASDVRDGLDLAFVRPHGAREGRLIVDGNNTVWAAALLGMFVSAHGKATAAWYDSLERDPDRARALGASLARESFLSVQIQTRAGWERRGLIWEAGPEIIKRQVMALDLSGCEGDTVRVRLETVPGFWQIDRVAMDCAPRQEITATVVPVARAETRDHRDVRAILSGRDGREFVMETGDFAELRFAVPPVPKGRARSYVARTHGWYRVHGDETGEPNYALLAGISERPLGLSRTAVTVTNQTLRRLEELAR